MMLRLQKLDARWFPNTSGTAAQAGYGRGALASLEPVTRITSTADGLTDDFQELVRREMASAPWLTPAQAYARVDYARRAVEEANKKRMRASA